MKARRFLGQHYLIDASAVKEVIAAAKILPSERVLEIGTGRGALTGELVKLGSSFEGYEVDPDNYEETVSLLGGVGRTIFLADAFQHRPRFDVLVASLPYSKSSDFIEWIAGMNYHRAIVLLQQDFVEKLAAKPGSRSYRAISVICQISSSLKILGRIKRSSFSPEPRVNTLLVELRPKLRLTDQEIKSIGSLFSLRRRQVVSTLKGLGMKPSLDFGRRRVYSLTPEEVHAICSE